MFLKVPSYFPHYFIIRAKGSITKKSPKRIPFFTEKIPGQCSFLVVVPLQKKLFIPYLGERERVRVRERQRQREGGREKGRER